MSAIDDDKEVLAAEFVMGTLDSGGRANARMMMAIDPDFVASIARWERRLGELHAIIDPVDPSPHNWEWIKARIAAVKPASQIWMPSLSEASAASPQPRKPPESDVTAALLALAKPADVPPRMQRAAARFAPRLRRWRWLAGLAVLLACAVVALAAARELLPQWLPSALRPTPRIVEKPVEVIREVVREVPSQRFAEYVAVFQDGNGAPAFLLSADVSRQTASVRRLRAAPDAGQTYAVWITAPDAGQPRLLGTLHDDPFTLLRIPDGFDVPALANATFGISQEPVGNAPPERPSGRLLNAKLMQTIPAAFPNVAP